MPMLPRRGDALCAIRIEACIALKGAMSVSLPRPGSNASWGAYGYAGDAGVIERKFHLRHTVSRRHAADPTNQGSLDWPSPFILRVGRLSQGGSVEHVQPFSLK